MMSVELVDYERWRAVNKSGFTLFDYLRAKQMAGECSPDILVSYSKLFFPEFVQIEEMIFLKEQFRQDNLDRLRSQGIFSSKMEYWMNLLAVGDLIPLVPDLFSEEILQKIKRCWEVSLNDAFPEKTFEVRLVYDDGDTFLVFFQVKPQLSLDDGRVPATDGEGV